MAGRLFATVLGGVAAVSFILPPIGESALRTASDAAALSGYAIICAVIVLIIHIAIWAAEANVALAAQRQVLLTSRLLGLEFAVRDASDCSDTAHFCI